MSWKGLISRMSDECLMKQETVFLLYIVYQAVMRKFTLAGKSQLIINIKIPISYLCESVRSVVVYWESSCHADVRRKREEVCEVRGSCHL